MRSKSNNNPNNDGSKVVAVELFDK